MTPYHASYYAHELTKRCPSDSIEKLAGTLIDAQVDMNPHQVDAALFAFKSPFSNGAILADEVGLGKTIEAGLVLSQQWAERKRRILLIMPASLRKQWNRELAEKFFLPSKILEGQSLKKEIASGNPNPFDDAENLVICSYQFAARNSEMVMMVPWDLVVLDEAHRLRNVYKSGNKTARALRDALTNRRKLLLTATPLQNSLMELYGLTSFIDEFAFGDEKSFRSQYARLGEENYGELKARLAPFCQRTLRRQVVEYISYTNREAITREFTPSDDEQALYDMVSDYLRRESLNALPASQRSLMTLVMRKLLASSTFAIAGALDSLARKLRGRLDENEALIRSSQNSISEDWEEFEEVAEEWPETPSQPSEGEAQESPPTDDDLKPLTPEEVAAIEAEISELEQFRDLAESITQNAKGEALIEGLKSGFARLEALGAAKKAIIFTESRRTQDYLLRRLSETPYAERIVLFNGSNSDTKSREIYAKWKVEHEGADRITGSRTADMRSALVDYFRDEADLMIATEAAAEGINLQFCSLVVNYDLPWNPQRIEQRIGRCHRYGQKFDVVVVNFLNKANAADQRVYELLDEKLQLFNGVFGSSDEVLGAIESGVDFERRIVEIYQNCRTTEAIEAEFQALREELETPINERMQETRQQLLENFDAEVHDKLRVNLREGERYLDRYQHLLWSLTEFVLRDRAAFFPREHAFVLGTNPWPEVKGIPTGRYEMSKEVEHYHRYRLNHPLAKQVVAEAITGDLPSAQLTIHYTDDPQRVGILEDLVGKSGTLAARFFSVSAGDVEDHILFAAITDDGTQLDEDQCHRLLQIPNPKVDEIPDEYGVADLSVALATAEKGVIAAISARNAQFFEEERRKLDGWADDQIAVLEAELRQTKTKIRDLRNEARKTAELEEQARIQREIRDIERKQRRLRQNIFEAEDEILERRDKMLDEIEARLAQETTTRDLFTVRFSII
ncbi:MAG: DEAD/DEAH box helicase [Verrucomicrobiales bacterium]|nr:DEAD/DEAH box helicase [Verrucomicrobiales bacterium]